MIMLCLLSCVSVFWEKVYNSVLYYTPIVFNSTVWQHSVIVLMNYIWGKLWFHWRYTTWWSLVFLSLRPLVKHMVDWCLLLLSKADANQWGALCYLVRYFDLFTVKYWDAAQASLPSRLWTTDKSCCVTWVGLFNISAVRDCLAR